MKAPFSLLVMYIALQPVNAIGFTTDVRDAKATSGLLDERKDPYQKLDRLYSKDKNKCLDKATSLAAKKPSWPSPHYFSASIYFDQYKAEKVLRKKAGVMSKILSSVKMLYRSDTSAWAGTDSWHEPVQTMLDSAGKLTGQLLREGDSSRAGNLARKYEYITGIALISKEVKKAEPKPEAFVKSGFILGQYFGLPEGSEDIASHDLLKEKALLQMINAERKKLKMPELIWEEDLAKAARYHAYDMASQGYFEHDSYDLIDGETVKIGGTFERIRKFYNRSFVNSENLAAGSETASGTYHQWYTSDGHNRNMFNPSARRVGIGVYHDPESTWKYYWVFCTAH